MLLNEDLFLLTGKRELKLSEPQKTMIRLAQEMELPVGKGVLIFIQGPYGSGKTVLAIEIARIIAARREQQLLEEGKVNIVFVGVINSRLLLKQLSDKQANIDIKDMDELCQTHLGRRFDINNKQIERHY